MAPARQSAAQRDYSAVASGVSKASRWKIGRRNRRPRGLANGGKTCYRNGVLQALLHLPKFVSWIMQHNVPGQNWPCRQAYVSPKWSDEPAVKELGGEGRGCVPCLLQTLIRSYWGNVLMDEETGEPNPLPYKHESWHRLHQLTKRLLYDDPPDSEIKLNERVIERRKKKLYTTEAKEVTIRQQLRKQYMNGQQDADQFARLIFTGITDTFVDDDDNVNIKRQEQYNSLFTRGVTQIRTCESCNHSWDGFVRPELGFCIDPLPPGTPDDIASAIDRTTTGTLDIMCPNCSNPRDSGSIRSVQCRFVTEVAPEYLLVITNFLAIDEEGKEYKNRNPLEIPEELDITAQMTFGQEEDPVRMRYGLRHVVYHAGASLSGGHYTAAVTRMPQLGGNRNTILARKVFCDDQRIFDFTNVRMPYLPDVQNVLTVNPVDPSYEDDEGDKVEKTEFDPSILVYVRLPNRSETKARTRSATTTVVDTRSVADRIKAAPRIRRRPAWRTS